MPTFQSFRLPDVGEGLTEADIVAWHVAPGDAVEVNQAILEIETAKSVVELPCPWDGVIAELLVESGQTVDVGTAIVVVDVDPEGEAPAAEEEPEGVPAAAPDAEAETDAEADEASGDVLVGYGTRHASPTRRPRRGGSRPPLAPVPSVGTPAAAPAAGVSVDALASGPVGARALEEPPRSAATSANATSSSSAASPHAVLAKPPVRKLAKDLGVELTTVTPSGPGGLVTRDDVVASAHAHSPRALATYPDDDRPWLNDGVVSPDGRQTRVPVRSVRRRTAEAMVASAFTAPHVTVFHTVDVTRTMKLVAQLREDAEFADVRVTPLLIAAKALVLAIRRHPQISAAWDDERQEIVYKHYVNLGIAAATPRGLVVPNVKDAHRLSLHDLAQEISALTLTARAGRSTPADMSDGTVTITNVGVFGIDTGTPILNPGESAILAFGAITERPWVRVKKGKSRIVPRHVTQLALSFDHRLVDGELGSRVLADVARVLEDPARGLVWG